MRASSDNIPVGAYAHRDFERLLCRLDDVTVMKDVEMEFVEEICQRTIRNGAAVVVTKTERRELARLERRYLQ